MSTNTKYTIMPDFGGAYGWISSKPDDSSDCLRSNHACCSGGWGGDHPISKDLEYDFAQWQVIFERGQPYFFHQFLDLDWIAFHIKGLELSRRLKTELGDEVEIFYKKPIEDPNCHLDGLFRIESDGSLSKKLDERSQRFFEQQLPVWFPRKIISGGQTGVDRGALDFAINNTIPHGGWCPQGRKASDGVISLKYQLWETESYGYRQRTRRNVQDSDATLLINSSTLDGGTALTLDFALKFNKPCLVIQLDEAGEEDNAQKISDWMKTHRFQTLNVAGPREEKRPKITAQTESLLMAVGRIGLPERFQPYEPPQYQ